MSLFDRITPPGGAPAAGNSLFGSTTPAAAPSTGLFGNPTAATTAPANSFFGGATAAPTTTPTTGMFGGGMFGGGAPAATTAPANSLFGGGTTAPATTTTGMFGSTPATTAETGTGMFGSTPATTASATGGPGMFGSTPATTTAPASTGLFGQPATTTAPASTGLFGQPAATTAPASTGLFGQPAATTAPASTGLFGQPAATTAPASGGLFGSAAPATTGAFGTTQTSTGAAGAVAGAAIDPSKLTPTTRFGDCNQILQQSLEGIEAMIQAEISMSAQLAEKFPTHREALESIPLDASVLSNRLATTKSFQLTDQSAYDQVRSAHEADDHAASLSIRTLDLFRLPHAQRSQYIQRTTNFNVPQRENDVTGNKPMIAYFNKQADEMEKKMEMIRNVVRQVEESLVSVESQAIQGARGAHVNGGDITNVTGGVAGRQDARRLNSALREFNDALKTVSGRIVDAQESLEELWGRR
ncbi:Similar to Nucleoporin nup45; acc. no. Q09793 [Pyronema omphalodes CBS 100304]|uniref:Similar to Nucleoporin nup45 acc. no. Q09793 n=1 Tax=Pyronema omphalodes (strain CBS 100304) TaxID=1076935 RepID=U4LR36_PYROM|nr:Similar to Nucleoporin nup45; acc. no. Q09793 [Pyronema omphalodes CBS 100304]